MSKFKPFVLSPFFFVLLSSPLMIFAQQYQSAPNSAAPDVSTASLSFDVDAPTFIYVKRKNPNGGRDIELPLYKVPHIRPTDSVWINHVPEWKASVIIINTKYKSVETSYGFKGDLDDDIAKARSQIKPVEFKVAHSDLQPILFLIPFKLERVAVENFAVSNATEFLQVAKSVSGNKGTTSLEKFLVGLVGAPVKDAKPFKDRAIEYARAQGVELKSACFDERGKSAQALCLYNNTVLQLASKEGGFKVTKDDMIKMAQRESKEFIDQVAGQYSGMVQAGVVTAIIAIKYFSPNNSHDYIPAMIKPYQKQDTEEYTGETGFFHSGTVRTEARYTVLYTLMPKVVDSPVLPKVKLLNPNVEVRADAEAAVIEVQQPEQFFGSSYGHEWKFNVKGAPGASFDLRVSPTGFTLPIDSNLKSALAGKNEITGTITGRWGFDVIPDAPEFTIKFFNP